MDYDNLLFDSFVDYFADQENTLTREAPPSPVRNHMNLDLFGLFREPEQEIENPVYSNNHEAALRPVTENNDQQSYMSAHLDQPSIFGTPIQTQKTLRVPKIRIKREEEVRDPMVRQEKAEYVYASTESPQKQQKQSLRARQEVRRQKRRSQKSPKSDKSKKDQINIQLIVGLAILNAGGEALNATAIYDFFTTYFVKYSTELKNKNSWQNNVRTKLTFVDRFTKIPGPPGTSSKSTYILNLSEKNWVKEELDRLEENLFFDANELTDPSLWEAMKQVPTKASSDDILLDGLSQVQYPTPGGAYQPVCHPSNPHQFQRNINSLQTPSHRQVNVPTAPASLPMKIISKNVTSQMATLRDARAAFSIALHNAKNQYRPEMLAFMPPQPQVVPPLPQKLQPTLPLRPRNMNIALQQSLPQFYAIPAPQPYVDVENMPIEEFDAAKIFGFC